MKNQPCYDKEGNFLGWFSRSIACAAFVFCKDKSGKYYVLGLERGKEAADHKGEWNGVCGYLDFDETLKDCIGREIKEESGLDLSSYQFNLVGINDKPTENRQNVTARFEIIIGDKTIDDFVFSKDGNEGEEVGEIRWIPIEEINNYNWAFGHNEIYKTLAEKLDY